MYKTSLNLKWAVKENVAYHANLKLEHCFPLIWIMMMMMMVMITIIWLSGVLTTNLVALNICMTLFFKTLVTIQIFLSTRANGHKISPMLSPNFNTDSCTPENVGRLITPAKKLEDTIRLAELVIEVLQQNEEHHAEVSGTLGNGPGSSAELRVQVTLGMRCFHPLCFQPASPRECKWKVGEDRPGKGR